MPPRVTEGRHSCGSGTGSASAADVRASPFDSHRPRAEGIEDSIGEESKDAEEPRPRSYKHSDVASDDDATKGEEEEALDEAYRQELRLCVFDYEKRVFLLSLRRWRGRWCRWWHR